MVNSGLPTPGDLNKLPPPADVLESKGFFPKSSLPTDLNVQPEPVTDDLETLEAAYKKFTVEEYSGEGSTDYRLENNSSAKSFTGKLSDFARESNRERDRVWLTGHTSSITVEMDGETYFRFYMFLKSANDDVYGMCNGILVEVAGEAIELYGGGTCEETEFGFDSHGFTIYQPGKAYIENDLRRAFMLMSQNPFVVKIVDLDGVEHIFTFEAPETLEESSRNRAAQSVIATAFQAEKYVELGFGY